MAELSKTYEPAEFQDRVTQKWLDAGAFDAEPDDRPADQRYVVMMPLPNVTGALHMGHALDNVMQDLLVRWNRMRGKNTLWQPGTDHAGIATQAVVEKRLLEFEGKTRHDIGRDGLVKRIWQWKDEYQARIIKQQQAMGCSCDWRRQRFTMDPVCSASVRENFFKLFRDGLIYRGNRLVNWDCHLQTAVSDDEVYHETVQGHFWHLRYPIIDPKDGEPEFVIVATTRPETMLGDTAVACHPNPRASLEASIAEAEGRLAEASEKDKEAVGAEIERLKARVASHLAGLEQLAKMASDGRKVRLPLLDREIPLIVDEWAKPELGSGCVKITPAHDPNDYEVWGRHKDVIDLVNILNADGTLNTNAGPYSGQDRFDARANVVADFDKQGLLDAVEDREVEIGHSDRSKTAIEPYLSKQWFVRMGDVEGGVRCGVGTEFEFTTPGLAQVAIDATTGNDYFATSPRLDFHPARYQGQYVSWLAEKRDWCISRQLWWGHRIPVWVKEVSAADAGKLKVPTGDDVFAWAVNSEGVVGTLDALPDGDTVEVQVCVRAEAGDSTHGKSLEDQGFKHDEDVLDTWFSSALWPFSTLGWPDPEHAPIEEGQRDLSDALDYYHPGSCLVTGRDIITLWVARMLIMGLYNNGVVPFTDCFVHAKILDGRGVTMSKSRGNGVDPLNIIERYGVDAMRYLVADIETGMQDVRLPVQAECPSCKKVVELAEAKHGQTMFTWLCTHCKTEFDVLGTMEDVPYTPVFSDRFDIGRNFCNKLWNVTTGVGLRNFKDMSFQPLSADDLAPEDRWILSRMNRAVETVTKHLADYKPSAALNASRDFFWGEVCDRYAEYIKPRLKDEATAPVARQVLATVLDQVLRLLHPILPFITEVLWESLGEAAPERGIGEKLSIPELCIAAPWPAPFDGYTDEKLEADFEHAAELITAMNHLRNQYEVPSKQLPGVIRASGATLAVVENFRDLIMSRGRLDSLNAGPDVDRPDKAASHIVGDAEIFLGDVLDPEKERVRLQDQLKKLQGLATGVEKKLANEKFVSRAPEKVVQAERTKLEDYQTQIAALQANLDAIEG